jgi:hypothetical protein
MPAPPAGNGVAIVALVLGIVALVFGLIPFMFFLAIPLGIAAVVCGFIGRGKAKQVQRGGGAAVGGLVTGLLGIAASVAWIAFIAVAGFGEGGFDFDFDVTDDPEGRIVTDVFDLGVGDCFNDPDFTGEIDEVDGVPCSQPHDNEVFATIDHPGSGAYPGESEILSFASEQCEGEVFRQYVGVDYLDSRFFVDALYPTEGSWRFGDRTIVCFLYDREPTSGSARGSNE